MPPNVTPLPLIHHNNHAYTDDAHIIFINAAWRIKPHARNLTLKLTRRTYACRDVRLRRLP